MKPLHSLKKGKFGSPYSSILSIPLLSQDIIDAFNNFTITTSNVNYNMNIYNAIAGNIFENGYYGGIREHEIQFTMPFVTTA